MPKTLIAAIRDLPPAERWKFLNDCSPADLIDMLRISVKETSENKPTTNKETRQ